MHIRNCWLKWILAEVYLSSCLDFGSVSSPIPIKAFYFGNMVVNKVFFVSLDSDSLTSTQWISPSYLRGKPSAVGFSPNRHWFILNNHSWLLSAAKGNTIKKFGFTLTSKLWDTVGSNWDQKRQTNSKVGLIYLHSVTSLSVWALIKS